MGGTVAWVYRNGQRLTPWMLYILLLLDAEAFKLFGVRILVSSGIRTYSDQVAIFLARYVTAGNVNGRRVYDTRVWNGVRYYRISSAGTVAVPGTSNHEVQGTRGAWDLRDTGNDAGITVASSKRGKWFRQRAAWFGIVVSGDGFGEGWHSDVLGIFRTPPAPPKPTPTPEPVPTPEPTPEPTLENLMAFKSVAISYWIKEGVDRLESVALDWETGEELPLHNTAEAYNRSWAAKLTEGGLAILTKGHFDNVLNSFREAKVRREEREMELARASAGK